MTQPTPAVHLDTAAVQQQLAAATREAREVLTPSQWQATDRLLGTMPTGVAGDRTRLMVLRVRTARARRHLPVAPEHTTVACRTCQDLGVLQDSPHPRPHATVHPCPDCRPLPYHRWLADHLGCHRTGCATCARCAELAGTARPQDRQPRSWVR